MSLYFNTYYKQYKMYLTKREKLFKQNWQEIKLHKYFITNAILPKCKNVKMGLKSLCQTLGSNGTKKVYITAIQICSVLGKSLCTNKRCWK
jgi:hypothetical protein